MKIGDLVQEVFSNRIGVVMGLPEEQRYILIEPHPFYTILWSDGKLERAHVFNVKVAT